MKFKVGDKVSWWSQSKGYGKVKRGVVVAVVPPKVQPCRFGSASWRPRGLRDEIGLDESKYSMARLGGGNTRDNESYLVAVEQGGNRKPLLYWPREALLTEGWGDDASK